MKIFAIDIGSNSVRLACIADGKTLYKRLETTRLGEGLSKTGKISDVAIERTALAVSGFVSEAQKEGADRLYAFATAAVRSASNGADFVKRVRELCGVDVDVISGEDEAKCGILGALKGGDGAIIDVGGASTEITVSQGGKTVYTKSVNIGTVRLFDAAGRDRKKLEKIIGEKLEEYGALDARGTDFYAIGGTATRLAAIKHGIKEYRPEITHGTVLTLQDMGRLADMLLTLSVEEIRSSTICTKSADVVGGGCLLLKSVMEKFGIPRVTVSESDNLEGYVLFKKGLL